MWIIPGYQGPTITYPNRDIPHEPAAELRGNPLSPSPPGHTRANCGNDSASPTADI